MDKYGLTKHELEMLVQFESHPVFEVLNKIQKIKKSLDGMAALESAYRMNYKGIKAEEIGFNVIARSGEYFGMQYVLGLPQKAKFVLKEKEKKEKAKLPIA